MDLTPSSNSAAVNLDRTEAELALHVADTGSEEEETPTQPQKVRHANGRVYREIQLQEKRQKKRKAWFWQYGMLMKEEYKSKVNHEKKWVCQLCRGLLAYEARSSAHINAHLIREHRKTPSADEEDESTSTMSQPTFQQSVVELQRHAPRVIEGWVISQSDKNTIIKAKLEEALVACIACLNLSFCTVESYWFIALLTTISNLVGNTIRLPTSHNTISSWVKQGYKDKRATVKKLLASSLSKIHLSFDNWSSGNHLAFTAVITHFCSPAYSIQSILIGFHELRGPQSDKNIAEVVGEVLQDYSIMPSQIGCFILDNAANNDTCITALAKTYEWGKNEVYTRRLRCFGHIINLVVQAFLFGSDSEGLCAYTRSASTTDRWRHYQDANVKASRPHWEASLRCRLHS